MNEILQPFVQDICRAIHANGIADIQKIQSLWSNYGGIFRVVLAGGSKKSVVAKCILLQKNAAHPRGWATTISHQRKLKSYQIEETWYRNFAHLLSHNTKVPELLFVSKKQETTLLLLEDLTPNFPVKFEFCTRQQAEIVVAWLAKFHATFLHKKPEGLWQQGSYWHLATRPDELKAMADSPVKKHAHLLAQALQNSPFKTLIHGDAKVANFCFSKQNTVAAVDFQYVGGGIGVQDLAYFFGSCLSERECEKWEAELLNYYFKTFRHAAKDLSEIEKDALEKNWRKLYPVAWADFNRFILGWMPTHHKLHAFALAKNEQALSTLHTD